MSNRPVFLLWISVNVKEKSRVRFFIPLPLFVGVALADMIDDLGILSALFCPRAHIKLKDKDAQLYGQWIRTMTGSIFDFMWEVVFFSGPQDFVDVDIEGKNERVKVKVVTR